MCVGACVYNTSCACGLLLCEHSSTYKSHMLVVLCLESFRGNGFIQDSVREWWAPSGLERARERELNRQTTEMMWWWKESKVSNKNVKRFISLQTLQLPMREKGKGNGLSSITVLQWNIFVYSGQQSIFANLSASHGEICITTGQYMPPYCDFQISHLNPSQNELFQTGCLWKVWLSFLCIIVTIVFFQQGRPDIV